MHADVEWKLIYVGSSSSEEYDQELDAILVGPVPVGRNKFVFQVCVDSFSDDLNMLISFMAGRSSGK